MFSASFFQEFWKRKQAEIQYEWDVGDFETEEVKIEWQFDILGKLSILLIIDTK